MKRAMITTAVGIATAFFQTITRADVDAEWVHTKLKENTCLTCHAIDKKKFGPSFRSLSNKFKGKTPDDILASWETLRVHTGVRTIISNQDLKSIFEWILTLRNVPVMRDREG